MKILYGVQGTGNGHISRSREVVRELIARGHDVQVLISGRDPALLPPLEEFGAYQTRRGLTFIVTRGKIEHLKTACQLKLSEFYHDIRTFDASAFDLAITDFEPLTARIARRSKIFCIGIGHQYAFFYPIPMKGAHPLAKWIIKDFAFCDIPIGLHWHHFGFPILPPIIPNFNGASPSVQQNTIIVYLPFEAREDIIHLVAPYPDHQFYIYGMPHNEDHGHIHLRAFSRTGFLADLHRCRGVICNAGFELPSEALQLGKKLLVRPLKGQMEQLSNALAMERLQLGRTMTAMDPAQVAPFLKQPDQPRQNYPDVARLLADWIDSGRKTALSDLVRQAWQGLEK